MFCMLLKQNSFGVKEATEAEQWLEGACDSATDNLAKMSNSKVCVQVQGVSHVCSKKAVLFKIACESIMTPPSVQILSQVC
jgi:hypothetical protein